MGGVVATATAAAAFLTMFAAAAHFEREINWFLWLEL